MTQVGSTVYFTPAPQFSGSGSVTLFPGIITLIHPAVPNVSPETVELVTFGPNGVNFQHQIPFSASPAAGFWFYPPTP